MASAVQIPFLSVEEYLHSSYEPDADYVDGVLEERNLGEFDHSNLQLILLEALNAFRGPLGIRAFPELRVQVDPTRFRVPDVCVLPAGWKKTQIVIEPPLLCVEVLSPRDRVRGMIARCQDYLRMGVPEVWVLDPQARLCSVLTTQGVSEQPGGTLTIPATAATIDLGVIFDALDAE